MANSFEFTGKTTQEAIDKALNELNVAQEDVEITVLEEAKKGLFGFGSRDAKIKVVIKGEEQTEQDEEVEDVEEVEVIPEEIEEEIEFTFEPTDPTLIATKEFLNGLFNYMGFDVQIKMAETPENIQIRLISDNSAALIGYRGEVLDSLQTLAGAVANKGKEEYKRVIVDCEGYRNRREDTLKALAIRLADKAVAKGRKIKLEPMNPFERRLIHSALSDRTDVKTESEGKDPVRYVVIIPENLKKFNGRRNYDQRGNGHRYDDRNRDRNHRSSGGFRQNPPRPKRSGFGATFLGNSFKNDNND